MKNKWLVLCCVGMLTAFAMTGCGSKDAAAEKMCIRDRYITKRGPKYLRLICYTMVIAIALTFFGII